MVYNPGYRIYVTAHRAVYTVYTARDLGPPADSVRAVYVVCGRLSVCVWGGGGGGVGV